MALQCILCNDLKGIIVHTNIGWVHLTCVNWMPDIWFDVDSDKTIVKGKLDADRKSLNCCFCKSKK